MAELQADEGGRAMTNTSITTFEYDVALSYASEDREYVRPVAEGLREHGVQVYYDDFERVETWGSELPELFLDIFSKKARFTVAFISASYVNKPWPLHEGRSALGRALFEHQTYLLPVRMDSSELPGLRPTIGYIDGGSTPPGDLVDLILRKLAAMPGRAAPTGLAVETPVATGGEAGAEEGHLALTEVFGRQDDLYLVMDLGGTKAYVSLMNDEAERVFDKRFATTNHTNADALFEFIKGCLRGMIDRIHELTQTRVSEIWSLVKAIGIAFPGPTDPVSGIILDASNFKIQNFPLRQRVEMAFDGIPTFIDNDVNLAVLGETWKGASQGYRNVVGIMIGTGIGGGIIVDGQIYRGKNKTAGEIGHVVLNYDSTESCGCEQYGCFEALASRKAMARDLHRSKWEQGLRNRLWEEASLGSNEIAYYYKMGDADAVAVVTRAAEVCGKAVFSILNLFNPEIIVFNGGFVQQLGDAFLEPIRSEANKCMNAVYSLDENRIPIEMGVLRNPVLVGACKIAMEGVSGAKEYTKKQILSALTDELSEDDLGLLHDLYDHGAEAPIGGHPESAIYKERLRSLRDRGLIRTETGQALSKSTSVRITDLGRIVIKEARQIGEQPGPGSGTSSIGSSAP
jgi:glucokinase